MAALLCVSFCPNRSVAPPGALHCPLRYLAPPQAINMTVQKNLRLLKEDCEKILARCDQVGPSGYGADLAYHVP